MTLLRFQTTVTGDTAVVALTGELDVSGASLVEHELDRLVSDHDAHELVIDLSELEFMDSTGLRTVVSADARAREEGRRLAVVRGPEPVDRIFSVTRLDERIEIVDEPAGLQPG